MRREIKWMLFGIAGQSFDALTTQIVSALGHRESNPLFRRMVEERRIARLYAVSGGVAVAFPVAALRTVDGLKGRRDFIGVCILTGSAGFLAGAWNIAVLFRSLRHQRAA